MGELTHGMNIEQVDELGRFLKSSAESVAELAGAIDARVRSSSWAGDDSDRFANDWWPKLKRILGTIAQELDGLGQSALNNAEGQRSASGEASGTTGDSARSAGRESSPQPHRPSWGDAWNMVKTVPLVGSVIEVGEFVGDVGNAGGVLAYEVHASLTHGISSPEAAVAREMSDEAMHRFNRGAVDVIWSVGTEVVPPLKGSALIESIGDINRSSTALDGINGTDLSKYSGPTYWVDGILP